MAEISNSHLFIQFPDFNGGIQAERSSAHSTMVRSKNPEAGIRKLEYLANIAMIDSRD
jgi:hypothetical protein